MAAYYNEHDSFAADCLEDLVEKGRIPNGVVDRRSIVDVSEDDIVGFSQIHLFAGIGGWSLALRQAGWPDNRPVWTGSCPCQPYSTAGKGRGQTDTRHLWPEMFRLIKARKPVTIFGEQVASAIRFGWLDGVCADLDGLSYTTGAVVFGAHSVGLPHVRQRLWWVADSAMHGCERIQRRPATQIPENGTSEALGAWDRLGNPFSNWKVLLAESDVRRVADGISSTVDIRPRLHAYGNAIVPDAGEQFIRAFMEI